MTSDLLIGVIYLVLGVGIIGFGIGVSYFIYRRASDDERDTEYGESRGEQIVNRLEEDGQFILIVIVAVAFSFINVFVSFSASLFFLGGMLTMAVGFKMMNDDAEGDPDPPSDSDPRHIDSADDIADAVESGEFDIQLSEEQSREELEEFVQKAEAGEFDLRADPGLETTVRIIRAVLDDGVGGESNMTENDDHARDQVFESSDGETLTLHQIGYFSWKEGGDIEQDGDAFVVDGTRYTPVDDEREP